MTPYALHDATRRAQGVNRFEERYGHQAGIIRTRTVETWISAGTSQVHCAYLCQPKHVEDIAFGFRAADDVLADRLSRIDFLELLDDAEGLDQFAGLGRNALCRQSAAGSQVG